MIPHLPNKVLEGIRTRTRIPATESYLLLVYPLFGEDKREETITVGETELWAPYVFRVSPCLEDSAFYILQGKGS